MFPSPIPQAGGLNIWMIAAVLFALAFLYMLLRPDAKKFSMRETMEMLAPQLERRGLKIFKPVTNDFLAQREDINWRNRLNDWLKVVGDDDDFIEQVAKPFFKSNMALFLNNDELSNWLDATIQNTPNSDRKLAEKPVQRSRLRIVETVTANVDDSQPQLNINRQSNVEAFATGAESRKRFTPETRVERRLREEGLDPDSLDDEDIEEALDKPRRRRGKRRKPRGE